MKPAQDHRTRHRLWLAVPCLALLVSAGGCTEPSNRLIGPWRTAFNPVPVATSPIAAVEILRQDWANRQPGHYGELFSGDYQFEFSPGDSAGNEFRDLPWNRDDELVAARNLFVTGTGNDPPARAITFEFVEALTAVDDPRPGKDGRRHKQVSASLHVRVDRAASGFDVRGGAQFYLVRGDSAQIPTELRDRGFKPDSNRWWIERWVDEAPQALVVARSGPPGAAQPTSQATIGMIKVLYR